MCYYPFFRTDLPDDDYTTLVPRQKSTNINNRKTSTIVENKEMKIRDKKQDDEQKTTITAITRRRSTIDQDLFGQTRSAPTSPATKHLMKQKFNRMKTLSTANENQEDESVSSERYSLVNNDSNDCLSSGTLEVRLKFDAKNSKMWIFLIKATLDLTQGLSKQTLVQIHLTVLPTKRIRFRTRVKPIDNAMFAEEFFCKVSPETMQNEGIRFRLYTYERFKRVKLLAEAIVMFAMINLDEDMCKIIPLKCAYPSEDSDLGSRSQSRQNSIAQLREETTLSSLPELEIGLGYEKNQSMLILQIGKGINFGMTNQNRAPNTYVQIILRNSIGEEIVSKRTITRYAEHQPIYAERYLFNIQENSLNQITLVISVLHKGTFDQFDSSLGSVAFGRCASGNAQITHWDSMLNGQGEIITRWHSLLEK